MNKNVNIFEINHFKMETIKKFNEHCCLGFMAFGTKYINLDVIVPVLMQSFAWDKVGWR